MKRCPQPYCNGVLFTENTEDGLENYCLAGHRFAAVALVPPVPLAIPEARTTWHKPLMAKPLKAKTMTAEEEAAWVLKAKP